MQEITASPRQVIWKVSELRVEFLVSPRYLLRLPPSTISDMGKGERLQLYDYTHGMCMVVENCRQKGNLNAGNGKILFCLPFFSSLTIHVCLLRICNTTCTVIISLISAPSYFVDRPFKKLRVLACNSLWQLIPPLTLLFWRCELSDLLLRQGRLHQQGEKGSQDTCVTFKALCWVNPSFLLLHPKPSFLSTKGANETQHKSKSEIPLMLIERGETKRTRFHPLTRSAFHAVTHAFFLFQARITYWG